MQRGSNPAAPTGESVSNAYGIGPRSKCQLREKLKAGGKLEDFAVHSGRPQSFPEEIQEAPKGQTLSWTFGSSHTSIRR